MARHAKKTKKGVWLWIGIVACICVMIYAGLGIYNGTKDYTQGDEVYESLREMVVKQDTVAEAVPMNLNDLEGPARQTAVESRVDTGALRRLNGSAVAWIYSEGTVIDYPVMQGKDNSYYLTHLYDGTSNKVGSIFLDYRNAADFSDWNSILYGHHMKSGKMFASMEGYKKQAYYNEHPSLFLYTPAATYRIDLFAGYVVDGAASDIALQYPGDEAFLNFVAEAKRKSTFTSDVTVDVGERLVTMVTCTYDFNNARYALLGKLTEIS